MTYNTFMRRRASGTIATPAAARSAARPGTRARAAKKAAHPCVFDAKPPNFPNGCSKAKDCPFLHQSVGYCPLARIEFTRAKKWVPVRVRCPPDSTAPPRIANWSVAAFDKLLHVWQHHVYADQRLSKIRLVW